MSINLRSMIFVPGYRSRFLERARRFLADALILDLEDSGPHDDKEVARENVRQAIQQENYRQQIYIRINPLETGLCAADLEAMMLPQIAGFMPTKIHEQTFAAGTSAGEGYDKTWQFYEAPDTAACDRDLDD